MENALPAFYRTVDPIQNLVVRVSIRKQRDATADPAAPAPSLVVSTSVAFNPGGPSEAGAGGAASGFEDEHAEHVVEFGWQQKVFGPGELLRLNSAISDRKQGRAPRGGFSPLQREYMGLLEGKLDAGEAVFDKVSDIMLFTYTDRDGYTPPSEIKKSLLAGGDAGGLLPAGGLGFGEGNPSPAAGGALGGNASGSDSGPNTPSRRALNALLGGATTPGGSSSSSRPSASSSLAAAVTNPLSDPKSAVAAAYRERPFSCMYVMAAVSVHKESYRARKADTRMFEVPLLMVKHYANTSGGAGGHEGGGGVGESTLLEMRPGFAEPLPLDPSVMRAALSAGLTTDSVLGTGKYGGDLRLRTLSLPPSVSQYAAMAATSAAGGLAGLPFGPSSGIGGSSTAVGMTSVGRSGMVMSPNSNTNTFGGQAPPSPARMNATTGELGTGRSSSTGSTGGEYDLGETSGGMRGGISNTTAMAAQQAATGTVGAILEVHSFRTPDGSSYEFSVVNPSEDAVTAVLAAQAAAATGDTVLALTANLASPLAAAELMAMAQQPPSSYGGASGAANQLRGLLTAGGAGGQLSLAPATAAEVASALALATGDPLAAVLAAERRAVASSSYSSSIVASDAVTAAFKSSIPRSVKAHGRAFRLTTFLEIVAAAKFYDADSVFVAFELFLPPGGGWTLLADASGQPFQAGNLPPALTAPSKSGRAGVSGALLSDVATASLDKKPLPPASSSSSASTAVVAPEYGAVVRRKRLQENAEVLQARERRKMASKAAASSSLLLEDGGDEGDDAGTGDEAEGAALLLADFGRSGPKVAAPALRRRRHQQAPDALSPSGEGSSGSSGWAPASADEGADDLDASDSEGENAAPPGSGGRVKLVRGYKPLYGDADSALDLGATTAAAVMSSAGISATPALAEDMRRAKRFPVTTSIAGVTQVAGFTRKRWAFQSSAGASGTAAASSAGGRPGFGTGTLPGSSSSSRSHVITGAGSAGAFEEASGGTGYAYPSMAHTRGGVAAKVAAQKRAGEAAAAARAARSGGTTASGLALSPSRRRGSITEGFGPLATEATEGGAASSSAGPGIEAIIGDNSLGPATTTVLSRSAVATGPAQLGTSAAEAYYGNTRTVGGADSLLRFTNSYSSGAGSVSLLSSSSFDGVTDAYREDANTLAHANAAEAVRHRVANGTSGGSSGSLLEAIGVFDGGASTASAGSGRSGAALCSAFLSLCDTEKVPVAHLCYPLDIHLMYEPAPSHEHAATGGLGALKAPTLYFAVYSKDGWERHHVHGYGSLALPLRPGVDDHSVRTWVPQPSGANPSAYADVEADYHLGGLAGSGLTDITFVTVPSATAASASKARKPAASTVAPDGSTQVPSALAAVKKAEVTLNKLGARTKTSGELAVRTHTVVVRAPLQVDTLSAAQAQAQAEAQAAKSKSVADIINSAKTLRERIKSGMSASSAAVLGSGSTGEVTAVRAIA